MEGFAVGANAFEHASIGMALVASDGRWLKVNRPVRELLGYSSAELLTMTFQEVTHPNDLQEDLEHLQELRNSERSNQRPYACEAYALNQLS